MRRIRTFPTSRVNDRTSLSASSSALRPSTAAAKLRSTRTRVLVVESGESLSPLATARVASVNVHHMVRSPSGRWSCHSITVAMRRVPAPWAALWMPAE